MDVFKDYKYMYYACGVMVLVSGISLFIMNFYNYRMLDREDKQEVAVNMSAKETCSTVEKGYPREENGNELEGKLEEQSFMEKDESNTDDMPAEDT